MNEERRLAGNQSGDLNTSTTTRVTRTGLFFTVVFAVALGSALVVTGQVSSILGPVHVEQHGGLDL